MQKYQEDNLDDFIDLWQEETQSPLPEYLGLTENEYRQWIEGKTYARNH